MIRDRTFPPTELHWSELKKMGKSPAHFRAAFEEPGGQSSAMLLGSFTHHLVLGGEGFVVYEAERRGNAWKAFQAAHAGKMIVTEKEFQQGNRVAQAVRADPVAAPLLKGRREQFLTWQSMGRTCGGTLDVIGPDCIVDLKTTSVAEPGWFARQALRLGYHAQLAWYLDGAIANGIPAFRCWIVAVETAAPFAVTVMRVTPRALDEGRKLIRLWMERVAQCEAANTWPGYVQSAVDLDMAEEANLLIDGEEVAA